MKYHRTMQEAFGPHTNHELTPMGEDYGIANYAGAITLVVVAVAVLVLVVVL